MVGFVDYVSMKRTRRRVMSGLLCNKINHIFFVHFSYKGMLPPFFAQIAMNYLRERYPEESDWRQVVPRRGRLAPNTFYGSSAINFICFIHLEWPLIKTARTY